MLNTQAIRDKLANVIKEVGKHDDKGGIVNPYSAEKGQVLQETRIFNDTPLSPTKCIDVLTKVLCLLNNGQKLTPTESTDLFFGVTKLFQSSDNRLRRMVYLVMKSIEASESEIFIVVSSFTKDMNSHSDCHRANAIRGLSRVVDPSMMTQIERYLKTAVVDKNPFVSSAALLCGINLVKTSPDVVRRWVNEVTECVQSTHPMVQFHALMLLYDLKRNDRLALHKVVSTLTKSTLKSPLAECLLLRYATQILKAERDSSLERSLMDHIELCLRHRSETVMYEAARCVVDLAVFDAASHATTTVFGYELLPALTVLQVFLTSPKSVVRFAAIRTLNRLAQARPQVVSNCNSDIEPLLTDSNRSVATCALTTLLKTGRESAVERLVKQISTFINDISDSYKLEIVQAVKQLAGTYPSKFKPLMSFLASQLREEGSFEFKQQTVDALIFLIHTIPASMETGLLQLCEFIEDCEYSSLCTKVLCFIGDMAPKSSTPSKYIRFIHNRLILENEIVRVAAVDSLMKIAAKCPLLSRDVLTLLESATVDNDDEVRERTTLYAHQLEISATKKPVDLLGDSNGDDEGRSTAASSVFGDILDVEPPVAVEALCELLESQVEVEDARDEPFDIATLPTEEEYRHMKRDVVEAAPAAGGAPTVPKPSTSDTTASLPVSSTAMEITQQVSGIVSQTQLGPLHHSCRPHPLTEKEAEYVVTCIKHFYTSPYVVLEFHINNTLQNVFLEDVEVQLSDYDTSMWKVLGGTVMSRLEFEVPKTAYIVLEKRNANDLGIQTGSFTTGLAFKIKEEGDDIGYSDEYGVEQVNLTSADYIIPRPLRDGEFKSHWESLPSEKSCKLSLNFKSLDAAVPGILNLLNLAGCDRTGDLENYASSKASGPKTSHMLLMSGVMLGGYEVLSRARIVMSPEHGCLLKCDCRSQSDVVCDSIVAAFE